MSNRWSLVEANTAFALQLYGKLQSQDGNLAFSPYSIPSALAMTCAGARGETARQMEQALLEKILERHKLKLPK